MKSFSTYLTELFETPKYTIENVMRFDDGLYVFRDYIIKLDSGDSYKITMETNSSITFDKNEIEVIDNKTIKLLHYHLMEEIQALLSIPHVKIKNRDYTGSVIESTEEYTLIKYDTSILEAEDIPFDKSSYVHLGKLFNTYQIVTADGSLIIDISFSDASHRFHLTKSGNQFKIFSVVFDLYKKQFLPNITNTKIKYIIFSAKEPSRIKLYKAMAEKYSRIVTTFQGKTFVFFVIDAEAVNIK